MALETFTKRALPRILLGGKAKPKRKKTTSRNRQLAVGLAGAQVYGDLFKRQ